MNTFFLRPAAAALVLAASSVASVASAQDKPDGQFHGAATLGAAFSSGAVNNTTISAGFDTARKTADDKLSLYGVAARGSKIGRAHV